MAQAQNTEDTSSMVDCILVDTGCCLIFFIFKIINRPSRGKMDEVNSMAGTVVRALAFHRCGPGSIPGFDAICGLILLLLYSALRGFFPGTRVFPFPQNTNI